MPQKASITRVEQVPIHGLKHTISSPVSRGMETSQIKDVQVIRNQPPTQEYMPLGYNFSGVADRVARANFWGFNVGLDPHFVESDSTGNTHPIQFEKYVRSTTDSYGTNSNQFIWDPIPELENFPVSGFPEQVSQQYVLYNVKPGYVRSAKQAIHLKAQSTPTAYSAPVNTSKSQTVVYQTPLNDLSKAASSNSLWNRIKRVLVGS